jgi:hypothetical protein
MGVRTRAIAMTKPILNCVGKFLLPKNGRRLITIPALRRIKRKL